MVNDELIDWKGTSKNRNVEKKESFFFFFGSFYINKFVFSIKQTHKIYNPKFKMLHPNFYRKINKNMDVKEYSIKKKIKSRNSKW